jgi:anti-sigma factor RsiW
MNQHDPKSEPCESADALRTAYALGELNDAARVKALRRWESDPAAKQDAERWRRCDGQQPRPPLFRPPPSRR